MKYNIYFNIMQQLLDIKRKLFLVNTKVIHGTFTFNSPQNYAANEKYYAYNELCFKND